MNEKLPALDPTTPWYEYLSYQECCRSLNRPERLSGWLRYQQYYKNNFKEGKNNLNNG
jgi:hypothetical protein